MKLIKFQHNYKSLAITAIILIAYCLISDYLIETRPIFKREYWALYDGVVHGLVGVIILLPFFKEYNLYNFSLIFFISTIIDIDHFILAGSFSVSDAINLPMRPITHSITFALIFGFWVFIFFRTQPFVFWIVFAALTSHVVRDASSGLTLIFYPFSISKIPYFSYLLVEILLLYLSYFIHNKFLEK
ncbi:hypothetical protein SAMN05421780_11917 [Flexibacter flexilis DSM 6793]|uniref:Inner membrane protein n=1 Tax=Flexibacter flexilis DSM 6793 TaxID=927664 RepID=A0A1I1P1K7_9BACT|nr:metal-dependent hydrolase [Flexibacter flexilis]SFD00843.1 hypothetical protein SAMN05421780_11917 [Flexibacter flexilis DSM 6793]